METYNNPVLEKLPQHLRKYVVPQHYERYTPVDQAIWRYVMRQNYAYLKDVAYYPYIPGLRKAGLSIERIPDLQTMNDSLKQIGWGAVTVDGFIPPSAFMEFQAHRVLVIAADIRQLEHIEYTPAPDIIHESSGHAPIIGEPEYAEYLQYFGEIGSKAMFSAKDFEQYEVIRKLSILKESHDANEEEIADAEALLGHIQQNMGEPSEMALLSRLHWWTVEYGLIGTVEDPKIYGAGLLSSIGESASCMKSDVPKLPYDSNTVAYTYDITKPQPQLFVTPDFKHLKDVLDKFADTMAFRMGGKASVDKAIACDNVCTVVYSSGLQVSGVFQHIASEKTLDYIKTSGPTALSYQYKQMEGHGKSYHKDGFSSPVGRLVDSSKALEDFTDEDLNTYHIKTGNAVDLVFVSGIKVNGVVKSIERRDDKILLIAFSDCCVVNTQSGEQYFEPDWGIYDMAVGEDIVSVFSGAADKDLFEQKSAVSEIKSFYQKYDEQTLKIQQFYATIRSIRENNHAEIGELKEVYKNITERYQNDWLSLIEILEIAVNQQEGEFSSKVESRLHDLIKDNHHVEKLINDGIRLAKDNDIAILL